MTFEEYFGGWVRVIDTKELNKVVGQVSLIRRDLLYNNLKVVMIGQDPYPQKDVATGVLFGEQAKTLKPYINKNTDIILEEKHPAYYARQEERMPSTVFQEVSELTKEKYGEPIVWFSEY